MADKRITELTNITGANLADADEFVVVDSSASETKAITWAELKSGLDTSTGFVRVTGDTMTGDLTFGDNNKAIFGAGSDLQIYHDGSNSIIRDAGVGDMQLWVNDLRIYNAAGTTPLFTLFDTGATNLGYAGAFKLATTSTGVDVTGTVTADGLTVDGAVQVNATVPSLVLEETDTVDINGQVAVVSGVTHIRTINDAGNSVTNRLSVSNSTGDISFYSADGLSQSLFWDASAEALLLGTTTPVSNNRLVIEQASGDGANSGFYLQRNGAAGQSFKIDIDSSNVVNFRRSTVQAMAITSTGDVGIGTSSPSYALSVAKTTTGTHAIDAVNNTTGAGSTRLILRNPNSDTNGNGFQIINNANDGVVNLLNYKNTDLALWTNATERMRIDSIGRVGIGTSSPSQTLQVKSSSGGGLTLQADTATQGEYSQLGFVPSTNDAANPNAYIRGLRGTASTATFLTFGTSNLERMRIDQNGNVGIGATLPAFTSGSGLRIERDATATLRLQYTNTHGFEIRATASAAEFFSANSKPFTFDTGGSERLRIDSTGSVGIGTSSPSYALSVAKTTTGTHAIDAVNNTTGAGSTRLILRNPNSDTNGNGFQIINNANDGVVNLLNYKNTDLALWTNATERLRIDASGRVGIGTSSPSATLHVSYSAAGYSSAFNVRNTDTGTGGYAVATFGQSAAGSATGIIGTGASAASNSAFRNTFAVGTQSNHAFTMVTNDTERMRIDSSGRVRVNTTAGAFSANDRLAVANTAGDTGVGISTDNTNGVGLGIYHGYTATGTATAVMFQNHLSSTVGSITMTSSATSYNTSSDYRLKEDVQPMAGASDRVLALNPVNFAWKADGTRVDGFLAHEAQAVVPEAVTGEKDAVDADGNPVYQGIDQSKLVPLLTAALQEALGRITALEARVAALEA